MATTNMPESVDKAIRRRFEREVIVDLPTSRELSEMAGVALPDSIRLSHGALRRMILQARRTSVMRKVDYSLTLLGMIANMVANG
jgi:AAA+ superfamily predicted ATPase